VDDATDQRWEAGDELGGVAEDRRDLRLLALDDLA
jgi:hypothetical protein